MKNSTVINKDLANKKLQVTRHFNAPVEKVWMAWTESSILDQWWAPKPWKAVTKNMNFTEGGMWLYYMAGPNGEKSFCRVDFEKIVEGISFSATSNFSDEDGNIFNDFPTMHWHNEFSATETGSKVDVTITFDDETDIKKIIEMGFEGGFTMALGNLDELLEA